MAGSPVQTAAFLRRNAAADLPAGALESKLAREGPLRVKLGIDPTAPDVHLGHAVVLGKLREFQDLGHTVVLIVGDYTARVGDPSGRSTVRPILSTEEIEHNAATYRSQAFSILDPDRTEMRRNGEWLDMPMEELFGLARTATVAQLIERDDFAGRLSRGEPVSVLELLYPLLQGYDSVAVRADVEVGGTDQTFNLLLARDIQRAFGVDEQAVLTLPILPGTDGERKMSKSFGNHVGLTDAPEESFGKLMSVPDDVMPVYFDLLLDGPPEGGLSAVERKRLLAGRLVARFHGEDAAREAEAAFDRVFVRHAPPETVEEAALPPDAVIHLPRLLGDLFGLSRSESRRLIGGGGVRLDGVPLPGDRLDLPAAELEGAVLQVGRRRFRRLRGAPGRAAAEPTTT